MYRKEILPLDSPTGRDIGYVSKYFNSGTIWKKLPRGFYISRLEPTSPYGLKQMLDKIRDKGFLVRFTTPYQQFIKDILTEYGYVPRTDPAGSIFYENFIVCGDKVRLLKPELHSQVQ